MDQLSVGAIVGHGMQRGLRNIGSIAANVILWILTIWIPYLNVGTTIGLTVGLVAKSGRGEPISPTEIFNPVYRKRMGDYFLTTGLVSVGTSVAFALMVIPGIVLTLAWSLAALLAVDKGMNPTAAITKSSNLTYGEKGAIFLGTLVLGLIVGIVGAALAAIGASISEPMSVVLAVIGVALSLSVLICGSGYVYHTLAGDIDEQP